MPQVTQKPRDSGLSGFRGRCHGGSDRLDHQVVGRLDQKWSKWFCRAEGGWGVNGMLVNTYDKKGERDEGWVDS